MLYAKRAVVAVSFALIAAAGRAEYGAVPLTFEANAGQTADAVKFLARSDRYVVFLTPTETVLAYRDRAVRMRFIGGNQESLSGIDLQAGRSNYFIGNDPAKWRRHIANYARVRAARVYRGIDVVYHADRRQLEYDFEVAPNIDPRTIRMAFTGVDDLRLDRQGNLVLKSGAEEIVQKKPVAYQDIDGRRVNVDVRYGIHGRGGVTLEVGRYDRGRALVIDPTLVYSTYLGGSARDFANAIAVDSAGNAYITGYAGSTDFPITQSAEQPTSRGAADAFIAKLNPAGTALVYSTYLGGTNFLEYGSGIAIDASGNAYVTGYTSSDNFPIVNAAQPFYGGSSSDAFVTKLNAAGDQLLYSTYIGGSGIDYGNAIAVDASGSAYVTGAAGIRNGGATFPTTTGAFQELYPGSAANYSVFVTKLSPGGDSFVYSTFLGGSTFGTSPEEGTGIAVDATGNAFVTGYTYSPTFPTTTGAFQRTYTEAGDAQGFITKMNATGGGLVYSTYLGGTPPIFPYNGYGDHPQAIAINSAGNAYVTGQTQSATFPTTSGAFQTTGGYASTGFVTEMNPAGTAPVFSTYVGCNPGHNWALALALDSGGNVYITGKTTSADCPTLHPIQLSPSAGYEAFITKLNPTGSALVYSSYLGGNSDDYGNAIAVDAGGNAYVAGTAKSTNFPTTPNAFQTTNHGACCAYMENAFIAKISSVTHGDFNGDGAVDAGDVFALIEYLFFGGAAPAGSADANGDGHVDVTDLFYLINYLYAGGPPPK